jgi:O-antigen/teichoic acid export membrane protein
MKRPSGFYSSLLLLVLLNAVIKPLWIFAIDRQVQNVVGIELYGTYFSLFNLSVVFSFLADWGFTSFFNRQLAARDKDVLDQPGNFLLLKLIFSVLYAGVVCLAAWFSGVERWDILIYVILIQVFASLFVFLRAIITAHQWFQADAWLSIMDKTLMIVFCGTLLYYPAIAGSITIERFLLLQVACLAVAAIAAFAYLVKKSVPFFIHKKWFPGKQVFRQVLPFGIIVLVMAVHAKIDAFLLERINTNGAYEAGIYATAYRLLDAANMLGYLVSAFTLPYIARRWSEQAEIGTVVLRFRHFSMMFSAGLIAIAVFLATWIQQLLYHHGDAYASEVLQWCIPSVVGYALVQVYGTALTATGRIVDFCYINLVAVGINLALNFLLIPAWGAKGCCIAALCSQLFAGIATMLYANQKLHTGLHFRSLLIYIFTGALLSAFFYTCRDWPIAKWLLIIVAMMITMGIMIATKLAGLSVVANYWRKQKQ